MTRLEHLRLLAVDARAKLRERDRQTIGDILARARRFGKVTDKQDAFIMRLINEADARHERAEAERY